MLVYDIAAKLFRVFSKYGRSLWTRLEKCCTNTVYTTKPQNTNKVYRTNQVYLITPKCKSSLNNDTGIQTVKKLCDVNTFSPVLLIHHCLAQTTNVTMVGQYHLSLSLTSQFYPLSLYSASSYLLQFLGLLVWRSYAVNFLTHKV